MCAHISSYTMTSFIKLGGVEHLEKKLNVWPCTPLPYTKQCLVNMEDTNVILCQHTVRSGFSLNF